MDRVHALLEQVHIELLKAVARQAAEEINILEKRVQLDGRLLADGKGPLHTLAGRVQEANRAHAAADVLLVLPLDLLQCTT